MNGRLPPTFVRYLVVGTSLFLLDFIMFMVLVRLMGVDLRLAQAASRSVGAGLGFFAHRYLSFRATRDRAAFHWVGQGVGYVVAAVVLNVGVSPLVVWGMYLVLAGRLVIAKLASDAVMVFFSYVLLRLVFRTRPRGAAEVVSG